MSPPSRPISNPTLATIFKNEGIKKTFVKDNPKSDKIKTFIFHHSEVQQDKICTTCEREVAEADGTTKVNSSEVIDAKNNLIWCFSCDKLVHLVCAQISELSDSDAPYLCNLCINEPNNEGALSLVKQKRVAHTLERRLKSIVVINIDSDDEDMTKSFFEQTLHVDMQRGVPNLKTVKQRFEEQQEQAEALGQKLIEARTEIANLYEEIKAKDEQIASLLKDSSTSTDSRKQANESRRSPGVIYAEDFENFCPQFNASSRSKTFTSTKVVDSDKTLEVLERIELTQLRQVLPIVKEFNGDPAKWLSFERSINLVQEEGNYNDKFMKHIMKDKVSGIAKGIVEELDDTHEWSEIMDHLRKAFGDPQIIVSNSRNRVRELKLPRKLTKAAVTETNAIISAYLKACKQAKIQSHDRSLALQICSQLESRHLENFFAFFKHHHPNDTPEERLDVLTEYLNSIRDTLPMGQYTMLGDSKDKAKGQSFQVATLSSNDSSQQQQSASTNVAATSKAAPNSRKTLEAYEIRDIKEAKHQGYHLDAVKQYPSRCYLCNRNGHYTVECKAYKKKTCEERQRFVDSKRLCQQCIITNDHTADQCTLKKYCGATLRFSRCEGKHHLSLHTKNNSIAVKKQNFSRSRSNAQGDPTPTTSSNPDPYQGFAVQNAKGGNRVIFTNLQRDGFQILTVATQPANKVESSPRTIKLFRCFIKNHNKQAIAYTVGDSAAEISLVKRSLVDALGITGPPATIGIQWTDHSSKNITGIKVNLPIRGILHDSKEFIINDCYAIDDFNLPPRSLNVDELKRSYPHLSTIPFDSYHNAVPAILLGSQHASLIEAIAPIWEDGEGKPIGVLTKLGYSIYGGTASELQRTDILNAIAAEANDDPELVTNEELSRQYEFSNSLENLSLKPVNTQLTADEKSAIAQAEKGLKHLSNGFIQMPLIWRLSNGNKPKLPDNFAMVLRRQLAQERKLQKNPEFLEAFNNNFKKEIDDGYIRAATSDDMHQQQNINYVPMSLVVNANKRPIKTRNVYDASAKYKGTSLNDNLLPGPNLLIDMLQPLMAVRENKIAISGDIQSMFNRIVIDPADQNCQRILWRANINQPMQIFIKRSMLFGPTSSPFVSQFAKNWIANKFLDKYHETANSIINQVYMDDWFTSAPSIEAAIQRTKEAIEIFAAAQMNLIGIQSNSSELLAALPSAHIKKELIPFISDPQTEYVSKVLGVSWNTVTDEIVFELNEELLKDQFLTSGIKPTKRQQCSLIARIFDIKGLLAPCIIRARILLQHSWKKQIDWDQEIADEDAKKWSEFLIDLKKAAQVRLPRQRSSLDSIADADSIELHTFSDAGQEAIAAVSYFVTIHHNCREPSFVLAKAKVAPLKLKSKQEITEMPRLELLAALVGARLASHIIKLHSHLKLKSYFWCDSEVVLRWIWNSNIKLPRFAVSPISEILETTEITQWRYVDTKLNVADLATKFQPYEFGNSNSVWFTGPEFIKLEPDHWPNQTFTNPIKEPPILCSHQLDEEAIENPLDLFPKRLPPFDCALLSLIDNETGKVQHSAIMTQLIIRKPSIYYCWPKLIRATARMLMVRNEILIPLLKSKRWRNRLTKRNILAAAKIKESIPPHYIESAELFTVRFMQHQMWPKEIESLLQGKRIFNKELLKLNVFLDHDQVLRIRSRVNLPFSEYPQKYAALVPRLSDKDSLTMTMLFHYHYMFRHVCVEAQMAEFRSKFWMTALREWLKAIGYKCHYCKLTRSKQMPPLMAGLPSYRVDRKLKPFEVTGLDCCGPFHVSVKKKPKKVWILLFTCTVTRFIHLEILENIDTQSTLAAITSTYAAHGPLIKLISDNGTNFVGASNVLHREQDRIINALKKCREAVNQHFISQLKEFRWEFIPVRAAWMGGFYERLIGELKRGMRNEIGTKGIDLIPFKIAMYETAHRLNCRPLTHLPVSHNEDELLTPHHLAKNRSGWPLLPSAHSFHSLNKPIEDRSYYVEGQKLADKITRRFYKNYLSELTLRNKWNKNNPPLNLGDLVLLIDPNQTRSLWPRGIIEKFRPSRDGIPRVAEVRTCDGTKTRAVQHLVKIEIETA